MKCKQCGNELKQGSSFCPVCGRKIEAIDIKLDSVKKGAEDITQKSKDKISKMSKKKKALLFSLCSLAVAAVITALCLIAYLNSPNQRIIKAVESGDSYYAQEIYKEKISGNSSKRDSFVKAAKKYVDSLKDDFIKDKVDYSYATQRLGILRSLNILSLDEICNNTSAYLSQLNTSKLAFEQGNTYFDDEDYQHAIEQYKLVIEEDKNYDKAQDKIKDASKKYKSSVLQSAQTYADNSNYSSAISEIKSALNIIGDDKDLNETLKKYTENNQSSVISSAISQADKYASGGDYENAVKVLSDAMKTVEADTQLKAKFSEYSVKYSQSVCKKADELINAKKYDDAISLINDAMKLVPNDESLKAKLNSATESKPVSLADTILINQDRWKWNEDAPVDTFGNDYSSSKNYVIPYHAYGEFRVYKQYKTLSGYIAPYKDKYEDSNWYIQIYADDKLVYTSKNVTRKTDRFAFNVNINNADYIKIEVHGSSDDYGLILSDLMLNK